MATPPTRVSYHVQASTPFLSTGTPKTCTGVTFQVGDYLEVKASAEQHGTSATVTPTLSAGAATWTKYADQGAAGANNSGTWSWVGVVTTAATNVTVTLARPTGSNIQWGFTVSVIRGATGIGVRFEGTNGTGSSAPAVTQTVQANSLLTCQINDWNAVDGADRDPADGDGWRVVNGAPITEASYYRSASTHTVYGGYVADSGAGGSVTMGLTSPATQRWVMSGFEFLAATSSGTTGTGAASAQAGTASGAGTAQTTGSGSATPAQATASGAGSASTTGSGAASAPAATASGAGTTSAPSTTGSGSATGPAATASGSGTARTTGAGSATAPQGTATGSGTASTTGTGSSTATPSQATGSGQARTTGSGSATAPAGTASGLTGTPTATGSGSATAVPGVAAGSGSTRTAGSGSASSAAGAADGDGTAATTGTGSAVAPQGIAEGSEPRPVTEFEGRILKATVAAPTAVGVIVLPASTGDLVSQRVSGRLSILRARGVIT